jgi:hypothetical protein
MRIARLMMVVAAACFAANSLTAAQGRGNGPAGHGPQIARGSSAGPNGGGGRTGGGNGNNGNAGVTPSDSGKHGGNTGPTPGNAGDRGKNAGGGGRGNAGEERGNGGGPPGNAREGHGNVGGGGRGNTDDSQDTPGGGRRRGGSDREAGASFVAKLNPQQRARLEAMLPSGMTLDQAAEGFRNRGQFIAALQQSQNHDISFGDLKAQMTGDNPLSLGEAMRSLGIKTDED